MDSQIFLPEVEYTSVEHTIAVFAAAMQLRQKKLELDELLFLYETLEKAIEKYEEVLH
jgi:hypothetical protein|tara:strand:+ start:97 stop:270 length:174 start_codon:yes stop_codon:yes gene_type:complete